MTKYILMQALTGSEWDNVEFALLPISETQLGAFKKRKKALARLGVDELIIYSDEVNFYVDSEQLPERLQFKADDELPLIVELTDSEVELLTQPEQTIKYGHVSVSVRGVKFSGFGKHTDEEFWCSVSWDVIESILNPVKA